MSNESTDPLLPYPPLVADQYTADLARRLQELLTEHERRLIALETDTASGDVWRDKAVRVAIPGGAVSSVLGLAPIAATLGTVTFPAPTNASYYARLNRARFATNAVANGEASYFNANPFLWFGNAAGLGGYRVEFRFGVDTKVATTRIFVGLATANPVITVSDPSALLNIIGVGADAADANLQIMSNDGAGVATKVNLGASFPIAANAVYRAVFVAASNGTSVAYTVTREDVAAVATGTIAADLPSNTTLLSPAMAIGNSATAAVAALGFVKIQAEESVPA